MKGFAYLLVAVVALTGVVVYMAHASGRSDGEADPVFGITIPPGYRDWKLISVAHEEGNLNDLRALLGNDVAIKAYREGKLPFPDGTIIARLAWSYVPSEENNKVFGRVPIFRGRTRHERSVYGQRLEKICRDRWLGVCSIQRRQTCGCGAAQNLLSLPRACQSSRLCLHPVRTLNTGRSHGQGRIVLQFDLPRPDQHGGARVIGVHPCGDGIVRSGAGQAFDRGLARRVRTNG